MSNHSVEIRFGFGCAGAVLVAFLPLAALTIGALELMKDTSPPIPFGDPQRGRVLVEARGCAACHAIPGAASKFDSTVGPPLTHIGKRAYIAGRFPNRSIDMEEWIQHPQQMKPGTAMPDLGIGQRDARDIAAYLETLR